MNMTFVAAHLKSTHSLCAGGCWIVDFNLRRCNKCDIHSAWQNASLLFKDTIPRKSGLSCLLTTPTLRCFIDKPATVVSTVVHCTALKTISITWTHVSGLFSTAQILFLCDLQTHTLSHYMNTLRELKVQSLILESSLSMLQNPQDSSLSRQDFYTSSSNTQRQIIN